ncbi:MAG TPA: amidase domain-containing protein [Mycobacteriales bacterium]|nr:amidase domain-containing protein [Mycobacteriales bacterium]
MVDFMALREANPELWKTAADDWVDLARRAEQSANDIYQRGVGALDEHWTDAVGERAGQKLKELANSYQVAAATIRGVVSTLDGLGESVDAVRGSLQSAIDYAHRYGLVVDGNGRVSQQPGTHCAEDEPKISQANRLITEAIESASRIDDEASAELDRLRDAISNTDLSKALDQIQQSASENQLALLRESLPIGADAATVRIWWSSLTPAEQAAYERALPVDLYDLDGVPDDVKQRMRGTDGYDRIEMLRWARQNVDNTDIDIFDNNCANFVSHALEHAGLDQKMGWDGTFGGNSWGHGSQTGWDWLDARDSSHTASWAQADAQHDFLVHNGGQQVSVPQAQPGDVIYWEQAGAGGPTEPGQVHHAAVVTSVTPDGTIHYTQHSSSRLDASLDGRLPATEVREGNQRVAIVRPRQTW